MRRALPLIGLVAIVIVTVGAWPQEEKTARPVAAPRDVRSIDAIINALYDTISGPPGQRDWKRFRSLFLPEARLIMAMPPSKEGKRAEVMSVEEWIKRSSPHMMKNGFFEREVYRQDDHYGHIAHVFSGYESRRRAEDEEPFSRGKNSIQLLHDGKRWWVVSVLWDFERKRDEGEREEEEARDWREDADLVSDEGTANMMSIPAGTGHVGVRHPQILASIPKRPVRRYRKTVFRAMAFDAFLLDKYEVTLGNYWKFLQTLDAEMRNKWRPRHHLSAFTHPYWHRDHYKSGHGNYPVTGIPFEAAEAYARWRGKRLPDEFEWEYAARGAQGFIFAGSSDTYRPESANVADNWAGAPCLVAVNDPLNAKDVSPFGCIGMGGNVSEWCASKEVREYNVRDSAPGKVIQSKRVRFRLHAWRGPNFESAGEFECVLSFQGYMNPKPRVRGDRLRFTLGFRCAK